MCFSLAWVEQLLIWLICVCAIGLIWLICVCAIVGILRLVLPFVLTQLGVGGGVIMQAINIVIWAVIAVFVVVVCFDLIGCLGGLRLPR